MEQFADGWVTSGWTKVNGVWYECGSIPQVTTDAPDMTPELTIHQVAAKLNELEARHQNEKPT